MSTSNGIRDLHDLKRALEEDDISRIKVGGFDIDGVLRGKYISKEKLISSLDTGFGFCDVIFGWDLADELYEGVDLELTGWHTGYPDTLARIDLSSYRPIIWEPGTAAFLVDFWKDPDTPHPACPRNLLKRIIAQSHDQGFRPMLGAEYEFFIFEETPSSLAEKGFRDLVPLDQGMFGYSWLRTQSSAELMAGIQEGLESFDIALEGLHTETGPGVYEAAIAYDTALAAADKAALFKTAVKAITHEFELTVTFMAKVSGDLPGCSGHLHQSLWNAEGTRNLFADPKAEHGMSDLMRQYIAGQLQAMPDTTALIWPTINSYKRAVEGLWSPVSACWGHDNRTCAIRAISGQKPKATRIEFRQAAADMNPYIAIATSLAAGLNGIKRKLSLPPPIEGSAYDAPTEQCPPLPRTLEQAVRACRASALANELVGQEFLTHYLKTRDWEVRQFNQAVTDWELKRYFEII